MLWVSPLSLRIPIWKMGMGTVVWSANWEYRLARGGEERNRL